MHSIRSLVLTALNQLPVIVLAVVEAALIYAATMVAKVAFSQLSPLPAAWWRVAFALLLLWLWRRPWRSGVRRSVLPRTVSGWLWLGLLGVSAAGMNTAFYLAIKYLNVGVAVAIEFLGPLVVAVLTGRHWREYVGIAIAVCGVVTLSWNSLVTQSASLPGGSAWIGLVAILFSGLFWGSYIVVGRRNAVSGHPLDSFAWALLIGFLVQSLFLAYPAIHGLASPMRSATWLRSSWGPLALIALMLVVSVFASFLPYIFDQFIMRRTLPSKFSVMQAINPAVATVIGLFFGEFPTGVDLLGIFLVICAVFVTFSSDDR